MQKIKKTFVALILQQWHISFHSLSVTLMTPAIQKQGRMVFKFTLGWLYRTVSSFENMDTDNTQTKNGPINKVNFLLRPGATGLFGLWEWHMLRPWRRFCLVDTKNCSIILAKSSSLDTFNFKVKKQRSRSQFHRFRTCISHSFRNAEDIFLHTD